MHRNVRLRTSPGGGITTVLLVIVMLPTSSLRSLWRTKPIEVKSGITRLQMTFMLLHALMMHMHS